MTAPWCPAAAVASGQDINVGLLQYFDRFNGDTGVLRVTGRYWDTGAPDLRDLGWEADCAGQAAVGGHKNTNTINYLSQEKTLKIRFDQSLMKYKEGGWFIKQTRYSHHTSH